MIKQAIGFKDSLSIPPLLCSKGTSRLSHDPCGLLVYWVSFPLIYDPFIDSHTIS